MSITAIKPQSLASLFNPIGATPPPTQPGKASPVDPVLQALAQHPVLRSLLGESGFECGTAPCAKTDKTSQASEQGSPQEMLKKLLDTLKQLVSVLEAQSGQKPGAKEGQKSDAAAGASGDCGAKGTGDVAPKEEDEKDPIQKLMKMLQQMVEAITQLQQKLGAPAPAAS